MSRPLEPGTSFLRCRTPFSVTAESHLGHLHPRPDHLGNHAPPRILTRSLHLCGTRRMASDKVSEVTELIYFMSKVSVPRGTTGDALHIDLFFASADLLLLQSRSAAAMAAVRAAGVAGGAGEASPAAGCCLWPMARPLTAGGPALRRARGRARDPWVEPSFHMRC